MLTTENMHDQAKSTGKTQAFTKSLKARFILLGFQDSIAHTVAASIEITKIENGTIIAECKNSFYRDTIVSAKIQEINAVAKEVWGNDSEFLLKFGGEKVAPPARKRTRPARKNVESLFDFASPADLVNFAKELAEDRQNKAPISESPSAQTPKLSAELPLASNAQAGATSVAASASHEPELSSGAAFTSMGLNADYSFANFVRGDSNFAAFCACEQVAKNPGKLTNPVFIYGATGLGKTHLIHSVGNEISKNFPHWNVMYLPSVDFVNEFITAMRFQKNHVFRSKFQSCDVLLIDDIQFLEGKESTQIEFFHIFNELCNRGKQIVITSDKYPKDIPKLEDRLKSRFVAGLITAIDPPSFEDRVIITEQKARFIGLRVTKEIVHTIAKYAKSNVREIQGVLNNLLMAQSMTGKAPTLEATMALVQKIVRIQAVPVDIPTIQRAVASNYGIKLPELVSQNRSQKLVLPRHIAMYLSKEILNAPTTEIAESFGKKDHTTVMHAIARVKDLIETDASTRAVISELKRKLELTNIYPI